MSNIVTAVFAPGQHGTVTLPLFQWDYGQVLRFEGLELPDAYEVHFANTDERQSVSQIGGADGVTIPDACLTSGLPIQAWVFLHTGEDDGETEYTVTIPVIERAEPTDIEPTPVQQDVITQAIAALNAGVDRAEGYADSAETSAQSAAESVTAAAASAEQAAASAQEAAASAASVGDDADRAERSANEAAASATQASASATSAAQSAASASASAEAAAASEAAAAVAAQAAARYARDMSPVVALLPREAVTVDDAAPMGPDVLNWYMVAVQEGSGTPAPDNVRPITGYTGMTGYVNADTFPVIFPTEAGTIYGGYVDAVNSKLVVTHGMVTYDGSETTWSVYTNGNGYRMNVSPSGYAGGGISDRFTVQTSPSVFGIRYNPSNFTQIWFCQVNTIPGVSDIDSWKAWLANNPVQFVYPISPAVEYDIGPITVTMLRGDNTISCNTGDTELTYRQDVAILLEALTRPDESDHLASAPIAADSFFTMGGTLYRATVNIATGETITPGSNCAATSIAEQLTAIYNLIN